MEELASVDIRPVLHISNFRHVRMNILAEGSHPSFSISKISLKEIPFSCVTVKMLFNYSYLGCVTDNHTDKQPPNMSFGQVCSPGSPSPPHPTSSSGLHSAQQAPPSQTSPFTPAPHPSSSPSHPELPWCPVWSPRISQQPHLMSCSIAGNRRVVPMRKGHWDFQCKRTIYFIFGVKFCFSLICAWTQTNTQKFCKIKERFAPVNSNNTRKLISRIDISNWNMEKIWDWKMGKGSWAWKLRKCLDYQGERRVRWDE